MIFSCLVEEVSGILTILFKEAERSDYHSADAPMLITDIYNSNKGIFRLFIDFFSGLKFFLQKFYPPDNFFF